MTHTPGLLMRMFVLAAYTVAAATIAWLGRDSAWWWVLHGTGAVAGICATSYALSSVPVDEGGPDQAETYMREED